MKASTLIYSIILSTFLSTACAKTDSEPEQPASENAAAISMEEVASPKVSNGKDEIEYNFSEAMQIPVDGSSIEAFDKSLETIKSKAEKSEYDTLTGAIDYLLIYDLGARRDRARLAERLDGLTGEQIVNRVNWDKKPSKEK